MQGRRPSSLIPSDRSSIRRRSGGAVLLSEQSVSQSTSLRLPYLRERDAGFGQTISPRDQPAASFTSSFFAESRDDPRHSFPEHWTNVQLASPVDQSVSDNVSASLGHPLPSSDFVTAPRLGSLQSLTKPSSYVVKTPQLDYLNHAATANPDRPSLSTISHKQSFQTDSSLSNLRLPSFLSGSTSVSLGVEPTRQNLVSSLSTSSKFTQKWPKPLSIRNSEDQKNFRLRGLGPVTAVLEDGRGLGITRMEAWNLAKWSLLMSVTTVFAYGGAALLCAILTWFRTWDHADVMYVADGDILILMTLCGSILLLTALIGTTGALLNSRPILAVYTLLLWPAFASILAIGYIGYKLATFSLDLKLNHAWSDYYTPIGRLLIQNSLKCCGFYDPVHEAVPSKRCYPRTPLPGCKGRLLRFERENLAAVWSAAFAIIPLHILNMVIALLASNHVTNTFGKGLMPPRYRLRGADVMAHAEKLFSVVPAASNEKTIPIRPVLMPQMSWTSSRSTFREDRNDRWRELLYENEKMCF